MDPRSRFCSNIEHEQKREEEQKKQGEEHKHKHKHTQEQRQEEQEWERQQQQWLMFQALSADEDTFDAGWISAVRAALTLLLPHLKLSPATRMSAVVANGLHAAMVSSVATLQLFSCSLSEYFSR